MSSMWLADRNTERDPNAVLLSTRKRQFIPNEMRPEWHPDDLAHGLEQCKKTNPDAILRSVSATYNCVGLVFATRRTWVEPEHVYRFIHDDGYVQVSKMDSAQVGDVVVYKKEGEVTHVGTIIERRENLTKVTVTFKILSKWGPWAEYIHDPEDVLPSFGKLVEVWTDRKII